MTWKPTGVPLGSLKSGTMREVEVDGESVLLVRLVDGVYATQARCTHEAGALADGGLTGEKVQCPEHGATFDVRDGKVLVDPDGVEPPQGGAGPLAVYATRVHEGQVEVDLP
ncbi:MAG: Rieske 2Fe-2S domain-containing protein [Euryarchaeota archaeon]|nr:Rieske 2Fe-2S domain-containing protein [Euryarchaeota archaeon]MDE1837654.1 Rieske 2Fe-2S domain-containing protein [Euryarchaeota archaeon]MDE1880328.1 Rieske 2Fe-2S domain-containing protein [Euryarchaeota archaeon]MDE2046271.1 Rieske 2Fe-2S domain-containing protein [Thermoplasmata archaeon]